MKEKEPNPNSESDFENNGKGQIIDPNPTAIVPITTIQPEEQIDPEIFWTSHHSVLLINILLKLSRNLSTITNVNFCLQMRNTQSMKKMALTNSLLKTSPRHKKRRVTGRQRRTPENGASSEKPLAEHR